MNTLMIRCGKRYRAATRDEVLESAAAYAASELAGQLLGSPADTKRYLISALRDRQHEVFVVICLDNRHRVLDCKELFRGTVDGASVHPREVVKHALGLNAAAVILAHNHPSGVAEPSQADELITHRLKDALALVEIRVLDHIVVGGEKTTSFAERGLL